MEGVTLWGISNMHVTTGTAATLRNIENVAGINDKQTEEVLGLSLCNTSCSDVTKVY